MHWSILVCFLYTGIGARPEGPVHIWHNQNLYMQESVDSNVGIAGRAYVYVKLEKIPRVVRGKILRQQLHEEYVGRYYVSTDDVKPPSVS